MINVLRRTVDLLLLMLVHPTVEDKAEVEDDNEESSESLIVVAAGSSEGRSSARGESRRWKICLSSLFMMEMLYSRLCDHSKFQLRVGGSTKVLFHGEANRQ